MSGSDLENNLLMCLNKIDNVEKINKDTQKTQGVFMRHDELKYENFTFFGLLICTTSVLCLPLLCCLVFR